MTAAEEWASQLDAWEIPQHLLDQMDGSPYGWPQAMWKRRSELSKVESREPRTTEIVRSMLGDTGSLIDIGAGRGRASLPLAAAGHHLTAVEPDPAMAAGLREEAAEMGVEIEIVEQRWPQAAATAPKAMVVMAAHVVYDCRDIAAFIGAMHASATEGVVIELTESHPWSSLAPYYLALHGLERPAGPTVEDLVAVVEEVLGVEPVVERWSRPGQMWFADWDEILEFYGRRLVLPLQRRHELRPLLESSVVEREGRLFFGDDDRQLATTWWRTFSS